MTTFQWLQLALEALIIPVGGVIWHINGKVSDIESKMNGRLVRLETMMEIFLSKSKVGDNTHE